MLKNVVYKRNILQNWTRFLAQMATDSTVVKHDAANKQFYLPLEDGSKSLLDYELSSDGKTIDMYHTETPVQHQGKGLARIVTQAAFDYASHHNLKVIPTCTYVLHFSRKTVSDQQRSIIQFPPSS